MSYRLELKERISTPLALALIAIAILVVSGQSQNPIQKTRLGSPAVQAPRVLLEGELDAPLTLSVANTDALTPYAPEVELTIMNAGAYAITAYALRFDTLGTQWEKAGVDLSDAVSLGAMIYPGQSKRMLLAPGLRYTEPIQAIRITIDFVEFADGTTWGADTSESGERLAGKRAGARALVQHFKQLSVKEGPSALQATADADSFEIAPEPGRSSEWLVGFRSGVESMQNRIKAEHKKEGLRGVECALMRPFDAHDELTRRRR